MDVHLNFKHGATPRNELELPRLYFVTIDQWINVIGIKAFLAWLKFYTWCDRSDSASIDGINPWEQAKIPTSEKKLIKRLHVGSETFFKKILAPLWEVGLIDVERFDDSSQKGTKPINIIVYKYPQNKIELASKPLVKIRNYEKEYKSPERTFAKKGGRPKKQTIKESSEPGFQFRTEGVPKQNPGDGGSEIEPGGFRYRTGGGSEIEPNNSLNLLDQSLNLLNNSLNSNNDDEDDIYINTVKKIVYLIQTKKISNQDFISTLVNINFPKLSSIQVLVRYLITNKIDFDYIAKIVIKLLKTKRLLFSNEDIKAQFDLMMKNKITGNWPAYFANGLIERSKLYRAKVQQKLIEQRRLEYQSRLEVSATKKPDYNWLDD